MVTAFLELGICNNLAPKTNIKNSELSQQHNAGILSCYLNAHETMDEYLARTDMHSSSVWATEVETFAVSNTLQTPIMVFCKSGHTYKWLQLLPHPCEDSIVVCAVHSNLFGQYIQPL